MKASKKIVTVLLALLCTNLFAEFYDKSNVNKFDQLFMQPYSKTLDRTGDVLTATTMLAPLVLLSTPKKEWLTEGVMYAEACLFSFGCEEIGKLCVDRVRPYMYFDGYPQDEVEDGDYLNAWPSAHTTMAFTSAAFTTYVFAKYYPDSPWRFAVAGGVYSLAAATAALRMASGNHFATDVLSGVAIGTLSGLVIPYLHTLAAKKMPESENVQIQASPFSLAIKISF